MSNKSVQIDLVHSFQVDTLIDGRSRIFICSRPDVNYEKCINGLCIACAKSDKIQAFIDKKITWKELQSCSLTHRVRDENGQEHGSHSYGVVSSAKFEGHTASHTAVIKNWQSYLWYIEVMGIIHTDEGPVEVGTWPLIVAKLKDLNDYVDGKITWMDVYNRVSQYGK